MTTFEDVVSKAKSMAGAAGKKTADFVEVTRLKIEAAEIEKDIASMLEGLGRMTYDAQKSEEDVSDSVETCMEKLDERKQQLKAVRTKIDEYRNAIRCINCGILNPKDAVYCKKCGTKLTD